jgi:hypothetical protein
MAAYSAEGRQHTTGVFDTNRTRQHGRVGRDADKPALGQRAACPPAFAVCRKPFSNGGVVNVGVPCQRDERVDVEQTHRASAFVECPADDLRRDRRRSGRHPDDRELTVGFDAGRRQATPSKLRDHRAERSTLTGRKLARHRHDVVIDVERRAHHYDASASSHQRADAKLRGSSVSWADGAELQRTPRGLDEARGEVRYRSSRRSALERLASEDSIAARTDSCATPRASGTVAAPASSSTATVPGRQRWPPRSPGCERSPRSAERAAASRDPTTRRLQQPDDPACPETTAAHATASVEPGSSTRPERPASLTQPCHPSPTRRLGHFPSRLRVGPLDSCDRAHPARRDCLGDPRCSDGTGPLLKRATMYRQLPLRGLDVWCGSTRKSAVSCSLWRMHEVLAWLPYEPVLEGAWCASSGES